MRNLFLGVAVLVVAGLGGTASAQHVTDFWLAQTGNGQLATGGALDLGTPSVLAPSGTLGGWAAQDPGFDSLVVPEPGSDLFPMSVDAEVWFEIVSISPGLEVVDSEFQILDQPGDSTFLGFAGLHVHNTWHVHEDVDPLQCHWHCTFTLTDDSGSMSQSAPITVIFQNVDAVIGDVDQDGAFTEQDHIEFLAVLADPAGATAEERASADVDLDGFVTADDECPLLAILGLGGFIRGDVNDDEALTLADAIGLLNYMFANGDEPQPIASGDVNGDGDIVLGDAIYLLNHMFNDGPDPAAPYPNPGC